MKRLTSAILASLAAMLLVSITLLTGCGGLAPSTYTAPTVTPTVSSSALVTPGTLTVGLDYTYAPYAGESNGEVVGIDADVAAALADAMGLKVAFVDISSTTGVDALNNHTVDLFFNLNQADAATLGCTYVGTFIEDAPSLFAREATGDTVTVDITQIGSATIAAQTDSVSAVTVAQMFGADHLVSTNNLVDAFGSLESGGCTYAAASGVVGKYIIMSYSDIVFACPLTAANEIGIGALSTNTELSNAASAALSTITNNGVLSLVINRWIGSPIDFSSVTSTTATSATGTSATATSATGTSAVATSVAASATATSVAASAAA